MVNNGVHLDKETAWVLQTPYDIRDEGMNDLLKAYASNFAKRAKNPNFTFEVRYRSKKKAQQESVVLHAKHRPARDRAASILQDLLRERPTPFR